jgi:hypothetical protein
VIPFSAEENWSVGKGVLFLLCVAKFDEFVIHFIIAMISALMQTDYAHESIH